METFSGVHISVPFDTDINLERDSKLFLIEDIAHSLSMLCRYGGHSVKFYSVAEHSVRVSYSCPTELALEGLMHDVTEAYMSDIISPLKPYLTGYKEWEHALYARIAPVFNLAATIPDSVEKADKDMCVFEIPRVLKSKGEGWIRPADPIDISRYPDHISSDQVDFWSPASAEFFFMERYKQLVKQRSERNRSEV